MFRRAGRSFKPYLRGLHSQATAPTRSRVALTAASAVVLGSTLWCANARQVHNDPPANSSSTENLKGLVTGLMEKVLDPDTLHSLVWGSNSNHTILPSSFTKEPNRVPTIAAWLNDVALRDLQFHKTHSACVDAKGDVYQWGDGFFGDVTDGFHAPKLTLRGKNILQLQLTENKAYALSSSGKVYILPSNALKQQLGAGRPTPASDSWWGTGWLWGEDETVDFSELQPSNKLSWGESFISIAAGDNHLLALTSSGRVFANPVNKLANHYGQLGFRHFDIPDSASNITKRHSHLHVELIPKSLADPYANATRSVRVSPSSEAGADISNVDDESIRFCPTLYEIPVLKGVECAQIAAGARTSFARTKTGRVLGWGANDYGQLGLGSNVALDTITVPTEAILWKMVPSNISSKCNDVKAGGDLTAFIVERDTSDSSKTVDVLLSGNGQFGGLGNNFYSSSQGDPLRVKGISSLMQCNERTQSLQPITPEEIIISPSGHVLAALNSDSDGVGGRDLMVWGRNYDSELGNGKKASVPVPSVLEIDSERVMLMTRKAKVVKDLHGKVWKKGVKVRQQAIAGYGCSAIYWKIA